MNIIFMGSPDFAVASLGALLASSHKVSLVVTQPDKPANRGQKITPCAVASFAEENHLPIEKPLSLKNDPRFLERLRRLKPDVIVVVAYGKFLPSEILSLPKKGCVNVHASLLPKYRGAAPINWAIINGEKRSGVTTMLLNERMDEGDVLLQCSTEITDCETSIDLHDHLSSMGAELLIKTLDKMEKGEIKGIPQDSKGASYSPKLKKEDGLIDWKKSAKGIYNLVRGLQPWPRAFVKLVAGGGEKDVLFIYDAAVVEADTKQKPGTVVGLDRGIFVQTGFGQLCILDVQLAGKKRMPAVEFLKGYKLTVGGTL